MFCPKMHKFIQTKLNIKTNLLRLLQRFSDPLYVGFKLIVMLTRFSLEWKPHVEQIDTYI